MSWVNNYVLLAHEDDSEKLGILNELLGDERYHFRAVYDEAGGIKRLEQRVWTNASSYSLEDMLKTLQKVGWAKPCDVLLMYCGQDDERWRLMTNNIGLYND